MLSSWAPDAGLFIMCELVDHGSDGHLETMAHPLFDFSHLTPAERAQLAVDLWDSIALERQEELPVPPAHRAEIAHRHAAYVRNPDAGAPWEEIKDRLLARAASSPPKKRPLKRRDRS